jgi:DNA-directed RNA polymerase subunit RPC12/RpoP
MRVKDLIKIRDDMSAQPSPFYKCACGDEYLVFGKVPDGGGIECENCGERNDRRTEEVS